MREVRPGDAVAATIYPNQVYHGVAGSQFDIHWTFEAISVVCQRSQHHTASVLAFANQQFSCAKAYVNRF